METNRQASRREVLSAAAAVGSFMFLPSRVLGRGGAVPPSDKLNIAFMGLGTYGPRGLAELASQNIVALCDVDWRPRSEITTTTPDQPIASEVIEKYPRVKRFDDWRIMLQQMDKQIDALLVCSADHTHAIASITAMKMGKHVYCEKPLANTIQQVRAMMAAERKYNKVSTQTGIQGHASEDCRMMVEWIRDGAIGTVKEIEIFENSRNRAAAAYYGSIQHTHDEIPIPPAVKWDLWLGPAPYRTFSPMYLPRRWRDWVDFGTGILGDHGSHYIDPIYWALDLGFPESIEAETDPEYGAREDSQLYPNWSIVRYRFPARGKRPAVNLIWHGLHTPETPRGWGLQKPFPTGGGIVIGTQGTIVFGPIYNGKPGEIVPGMVTLLPAELDKEYKRPAKTLPRSPGHWMEWVERAKAGEQGDADFNYGGRVSQIALLGDIAIHHKGKSLSFDSRTERFTNSDTANRMFDRPSREGWALPI